MINIMIISCRNNIDLSIKIANLAKLDIVTPKITEFTASEMLIEIPKTIDNNDIYIVQSLSSSSNDQIMELLLTINAAKHSGAKKIHLILPYIAYSRQDKYKNNQSTGMEVIASLLNNAGITSLITVDIHNKNSLQLFDIPVINIDTTEFITSSIKDRLIVMPDMGSVNRAILQGEFVYLEKTRNNAANQDSSAMASLQSRSDNDGPGKIEMSFKLFGDVKGRNCLLLDDIIDSGKTLSLAAKFLIDQGAKSVDAYATHALLSKETCARIEKSDITNLTISNSIKQQYLPKNIEIIDVAGLICDVIVNHHR